PPEEERARRVPLIRLHHFPPASPRVRSQAGETTMAMLILDTCINCGNCEPDCPNTAISAGDSTYVIASDRCTECVGAYDAPKCAEVCPVSDCIVVRAARAESRDVLEARYAALHP